MGHEVTLGGERLGGGKRNKVYLHGYERSTHNLSYAFRSTMSPGTLVPFLVKVALPGDTWDIDLDVNCMTHPTLGPLFGSYKIHLDVFQAPIRLYQGALHQNKLGIGNDMSKVLLPQLTLTANTPDITQPMDNQQMNPSCIFKYLGISGLAWQPDNSGVVQRQFNMIPWLAYWEIYKNYYANKQETIGAVIHSNPTPNNVTISGTTQTIYNAVPNTPIPCGATASLQTVYSFIPTTRMSITCTAGQLAAGFQISQIQFDVLIGGVIQKVTADKIFNEMNLQINNNIIVLSSPNINGVNWPGAVGGNISIGKVYLINTAGGVFTAAPRVTTFPLTNIDDVRSAILANSIATAFAYSPATPGPSPYSLVHQFYTYVGGPPAQRNYAIQFSQEGLALRTYSSDLFNNWINTTWIDDPTTGITAVTSVNVVGGKFTLDELNLSKKVYDMLNRIAISGGSYDDWLDAVYTHERKRSAESPIYLGGAIRNLQFQEVISTTQNDQAALGQLAGKGRMGKVNKGGKIIAKIDEPSYLIGLVSIVPNIDYSQGNEWDVNLRTMNDLHKPALDEIGFQNLITDQMAWWDSQCAALQVIPTTRSAGKQPAWINYMTSVNRVYGNFAEESSEMFMVLNRKYDVAIIAGATRIQDLTTYIDPNKFNNIFADTRIDAQNFWMQIGVGIHTRRKMSAKVMPNL